MFVLLAVMTNALLASGRAARKVSVSGEREIARLGIARSTDYIALLSTTGLEGDAFRNLVRCTAEGSVRWWARLPGHVFERHGIWAYSYQSVEWYDTPFGVWLAAHTGDYLVYLHPTWGHILRAEFTK